MAAPDSAKTRTDSLAIFRDLLQTSLPIEQIHLQMTNNDLVDSSHDFPEEEENVLETDKDDLQEDVNQDSESIMDQADRIKKLTLDSESNHSPVRSYIDETLPDLLRSGSPLRRRVSSPVSNTLKQVRREVELSRRRSLRLKAQVDKLQEQSQGGLARSRVTEEIQSIVKLLMPLVDRESAVVSVSQDDPLDAALLQLQNVARTLALNHTSHKKDQDGKTDDDGVILQQALRDRDDALAKKKAMETELLKSKTELMLLNNQLLEAVQQRLEMAIELDAWKDDVQTIIHHQVMSQQQAEQKKSKGFGVLRRSKQISPAQSPALNRVSPSPSQSQSQSPNTPVSVRWKERLRRGRTSRQTFEVPASNSPSETYSPSNYREESFQTISLE